MSDMNVAPGGGADDIVSVPVTTPAEPDRGSISATEAARQLAEFRWKRDNPEPDKPAEAAPGPAAPADAELAETPTDDQPQADPVEPTNEAEPALPTIEPPRSWSQAEKDEFATYPREAQEKIARREQERDSALRRAQNEAAEQRKVIEAERSKVEQARQQYETALPALLQTLQEQQQGEFADIRTMADVEKLAREDWPRYALWDAQQKKIAAVSAEVKAAQERRASEFQAKWSEYASREDQLLLDRAPELADKSKATKIADAAAGVLRDIGFKDQELAQLWNGEASISLRDHRLQLLILDGVRYREAKAAVAKPPPKPVPPVQRPGVSKAAPTAADAEIQALERRFEKSGSIKDAAALRLAKVRARA